VAVVILAGLGAYWLLKGESAADKLAATPSVIIDPKIGSLVADLAKEGGSAVILDGKVTRAQFNMPGADNVDISTSVNVKDSQSSATIVVTIKDSQPLVLTKEGCAKIESGMTYAQVGEALGGVMSKGRMGDPFTGTLAIVQGKRRIDLIFKESKVAGKSANGIE